MPRKKTAKTKAKSASRSILVPTDFSEDSARALEMAALLASALAAEIVLLHVDEPLVEVVRSNEDLQRRRTAHQRLERATADLHARGLRARSMVLVGKPADRIIEAAVDENAALIVLGARGLGVVMGALLGGVAYNVVRRAPCPVCTVKSANVIRRLSRRPGATRLRTSRRDSRRR
jgi:nucleotide-binding universal stress UspA family protein